MKKSCNNCLAICQMHTLDIVLSMGGMTIERALREMNLDKEKYIRLAKREGLGNIAKEIRKLLKIGE